MTKLKPCPFCGGKAKKINHGNDEFVMIFIFCSECQVQTKPYYSEKKAIEAWNRRANNG